MKPQTGLDKAGKFFEVKPKNELQEVRNMLATLLVSTRSFSIARAWEIVMMPAEQRNVIISGLSKQVNDKLMPVSQRLSALEH